MTDAAIREKSPEEAIRAERAQQFDFRRTDIWKRTAATRTKCAGDTDIAFQHLTLRTSSLGMLYGARFFQPRRWFGRDELLTVSICNDRHEGDNNNASVWMFGWSALQTGYSVWSHRTGCEPMELAAFNGPDAEENAEAAARAFDDAIAEARRCKAIGPLSETLPPDWVGKHWRTMFADDFIHPNKQAIAVTLMFTAFVIPVSLLVGKQMNHPHVMALAIVLFAISMLIAFWLPRSWSETPIGPTTRWFMTAFALLLAALPLFYM